MALRVVAVGGDSIFKDFYAFLSFFDIHMDE